MKSEYAANLLVLTLGIIAGVLFYQQYAHRFPLRYLESDTVCSLLKDVKGLYDTNSIVCITDMKKGKLKFEFMALDQRSEAKLIETITQKYLDKRIEFVIKTTNSTSVVRLRK